MNAAARERGLYKNGSRWWYRVRTASGNVVPRSTGTESLPRANKIARMLKDFLDERKMHEWLERAALGVVDLATIYDRFAAGELGLLRRDLEAATAAAIDADVEPWVKKWDEDHLAALQANGQIGEAVRGQYLRQVRALIPEGVRFPKSQFTEDYIKDALLKLVDTRSGDLLTGSTRRRYFVAWKLFYRYAKKRVPLDVNPFDDIEWTPKNNSPRSVYWDHETTLAVLEKMSGEFKTFMMTIFGSGMELGAALALKASHVAKTGERIVVAPGSKNEHREDRSIFVDEWAWSALQAQAEGKSARTSLWSEVDAEGDNVRDAFYDAQVAAGVVPEPPRSERTGKKLWGQVNPHTIHDARHTYCYVRLLGDDGEPRQSVRFCSQQLGHADEQMVMRIYAKANIEQRLRLIELKEAREGREK